MANPSNEPIIIKKRARGKHGGAHGGAWKVAFADFTLAMMALFMVLWISQVADPKEKQLIVQYINGGIFSDGGGNPFDLSNNPSLIDLKNMEANTRPTPKAGANRAGPSLHNEIPEGDKEANAGQGPELNAMVPGEFATQAQLELLAKQLQKAVKQAQMGPFVTLQMVPQGIRIMIHDNKHKNMFKVGQAEMQPYFEDLLLAMAPLLGKVKNQMAISGHTDALPYVGHKYNNWDLSAARALMAERTLEFGGVKQSQMLQVSGMSDRVPYDAANPYDPANRRVEILVLTKEASDQIRKLLVGKIVPTAENAAERNVPRARYPEIKTHLEP